MSTLLFLLQFKGFDPDEMAACTLLFEGTAEVSLYWMYVITIIMYMYHCVCVICRKWLYRKEEYMTSPQDLGKNILNNIPVIHAVQHVTLCK